VKSCSTHSTLLIGDTARPEFRDADRVLADDAQVIRFAGIESATETLAEDLPAVQTIILFQAYPDQFSAAAIHYLSNLAPLARLIVIQGSWCEGESRSGHPLQGVTRMYWHQAAVRIRRELHFGLDAFGSAWQLPLTATDEERLLESIDAPLPKGNGLIALWTRRPEMEELLSDACQWSGFATTWLHPRRPGRVRGASHAIYDGAAMDAAGVAELTQFTTAVSPAPVVALLDVPRIQDVRLARSLGAEVLAKPLRVDELLWLLAR
jgi:hypothetical protein